MAKHSHPLPLDRHFFITALAESVSLDFADTGRPFGFVSGRAVTTTCRVGAIRRALSNLIENAVSDGELANVSIEADATTVRIVVEDDGPGIDTAEIDRVFEPFVRIEASRSREAGGAGLGLAIARSVARSHGGEIVLETPNDGGLRAILYLPRVASQYLLWLLISTPSAILPVRHHIE